MTALWKTIVTLMLWWIPAEENARRLFATLDTTVHSKKSEAEPLSEYRRRAVLGGDPQRGKSLFLSDKVTCKTCHVITGQERKAGPDLIGIGDKYSRSELITAVLEPSKEILPDYATSVVVRVDGTVATGIVRKRTQTELQLIDDKGQLIRIETKNIEEETKSPKSLMPEGIHKTVSLNQFTDLIAYLSTLKQDPALLPGLASPDSIDTVGEPIRLIPVHGPDMRFDLPVWFHPVPGLSEAYVVLEQRTARIWLFEKRDGKNSKTLFADLSDEISTGEYEGLLCLAFHPDFARNRKYYLNYNVRENNLFAAVIAERLATEELCRDSGRASKRIIKISQNTDVHAGGMVAFGPDGYLYVGTGDGGPQKDPEGHGQDLTLMLGAILRIDVNQIDGDKPYSIPTTNPHFDNQNEAVRREIWAHGFRQAWRFSFDIPTGDVWVGDVGQDRYEEVTIARRGENHGWNVYEGFTAFSETYRKSNAIYQQPILAYPRKHGVSVTGGYVYRGKRSDSYYGTYIFGDFETRQIWALTQIKRKLLKLRKIGDSPEKIVSFGQDNEGELYLVGYQGTIYRLEFDNSVFE